MSAMCPACRSAMQPVSTLGVPLDLCPSCAGVWFDEGELAALASAAPEALELLDDAHVPKMELLNVPGARKVCPRCDQHLESYRYAYDTPVQLDSCARCHGIFVEDQELEAISHRLRNAPKARMNAVVASRARLTGGSGVGGHDAEHAVANLVQALQHWGQTASA